MLAWLLLPIPLLRVFRGGDGENKMTLMKRGRDPLAGSGNLQEAVRDMSYGSFMRSFTLPADADEDKVAAEYKDGLLKVRISRTAPKESKARTVEIKS